jgi:hypothetical protein
MASVDRPEILLLSLAFQSFLDESYSSLIDNLYRSAQLKRAKTASSTINYLKANNPRAILVTDEGLTKTKNRVVCEKVILYICDSSLVIVGLHFPNFTRMDVFDRFFNETFDLPWQYSDYHRTEFQLNPSCSLPIDVASNKLSVLYSIKVLYVKNAQPDKKIFVSVPNAMTQSNVFSSEYVDQTQAAVVRTKVGNGYLVYIEDVNAEEGSDKIILSLLGL